MRHKSTQHNGGTGSELIPARTESSKDGFVAGGILLTLDLVKRAETKLAGLHANRSQLRRRIRALHYILKTSLAKSTDPPSHPGAAESKINHDERSKFDKKSGSTVASRSDAQKMRIGTPAIVPASTELKRACRIALMESDRPQCCEQILQRIRRRESVCIAGFHDPMTAITQELREMLADGEVIQKKDNQLWQLNRDSGRFLASHSPMRE